MKICSYLFFLLLILWQFSFSRAYSVDDSMSNMLNLLLEEEDIDQELIDSQMGFEYGDLQFVEIFPKDTAIFTEYAVIKANKHIYGNFELKGIGHGKASKFIEINLLSGETLLIVDNIEGFSDKQNIDVINSISLTDGGEELSILFNGSLLDKVQYNGGSSPKSYFTNDVNSELRNFDIEGPPKAKISEKYNFEKLLISFQNNTLFISGIEQYEFKDPLKCNLIWDEQTNSCSKIFDIDEMLQDNYFLLTVNYFDRILYKDKLFIHNNTEYLYTGNSCINTGTDQDIIDNKFLNGALIISEIYPFDTNDYSEYLEIKSIGFYSGDVEIVGLGRGSSSKSLNVNLFSGDYLVISDSLSGFDFAENVGLINSISLTDSGQEIQLLGQDGQVMDKVFYSSPHRGKSLYYAYSTGGQRIFDYSFESSPGYDHKIYEYIVGNIGSQEISSCSVKLQHSSALLQKNSINLIAEYNGKELQNSNKDYRCEWEIFSGTVFTGCNPYYIKFEKEGIYNIDLRIFDNSAMVCHAYMDLNLPSVPSCGTCRQDYYQGLYTKRKDKYNVLATSIRGHGFVVKSDKAVKSNSISDDIDVVNYSYLTGLIKINEILPNPFGSDKGKEMISFKVISGTSFDLSGFDIDYGKKKSKLDVGKIYNYVKLTGDFAFPNSPTCVILNKDKIIYDKFCYAKPDDGSIITGSLDTLKDKNLDFIKKLKLKLYKNQVCIHYEDADIICKELKYSYEYVKLLKQDISQLNKDYKKIFRLNERNLKQIEKLELKIDKQKQLYTERMSKNKTRFDIRYAKVNDKYKERNSYIKQLRKKYSDRKKKKEDTIKELNNKYKKYKDQSKVKENKLYLELSLNKNFINYIIKKLKNDWYVVYKNSGIIDDYDLYKICSSNIKKDKYYVNYLGLNYNVHDYESLQQIRNGKVGIIKILKENIKIKKQKFVDTIEKVLKDSDLDLLLSIK